MTADRVKTITEPANGRSRSGIHVKESLSASMQRRPLRSALLVGLGLLSFAVPISTIWIIGAVFHTVPTGDSLSVIRDTGIYGRVSWHRLWQYHNEHRIVFTRLVFLIDFYCFRGAGIVLTWSAAVMALMVPLYYAKILARTAPAAVAGPYIYCATAVLCTLYFNGVIVYAVTDPSYLQHHFNNWFALAAAACFSSAAVGARQYRIHLAVAFVLCWCASSLASGGGILLGPAAAAVAVFVALREWRTSPLVKLATIAVIAAAGIAVAISVARWYMANHSRGVSFGQLQLRQAIEFVVLFVGAPLWRKSTWPLEYTPNPQWLWLTAFAFWCIAALAVVNVYRAHGKLTRFQLFHLFIIAFVGGTAVAAAMFRSQIDVYEAINKKYAPTALLCWLSVASLLIQQHGRHSSLHPRRALAVAGTVLLVVTAIVLPTHVTEARVWRWQADRQQRVATTIAAGVYDSRLMREIAYEPLESYRLLREVLLPRRASIFYQWPPPPYAADPNLHGTLFSGAAGTVAAVEPVCEQQPDCGILVDGRTTLASRGFSDVIAVDDAGTVCGYGWISQAPLPEEYAAGGTVKWHAAIRPPSGTRSVTMYGWKRRSSEVQKLARVNLSDEPVRVTQPLALNGPAGHREMNIETVSSHDTASTAPPLLLRRGSPLVVSGWAVDGDDVAGGVQITVDGRSYEAMYGADRPDVAAFLENPAVRFSGFTFRMAGDLLSPGEHTLEARVLSRDRSSFKVSRSILFTVQ